MKYSLNLGGEEIDLNSLVGNKIKLEFTGDIYCVDTGKKLKKAYGQGYSWESFTTLPECDVCLFKPELCHYSLGTCRDEKWGEDHCMKPHVIYLANSSQLKVGITRKANTPHRWMDQGASFALPILEVKDRRTSGLIEVEIAKKLGDKTNWRKMLKNEIEDIDLERTRDQVFEEFEPLIEKHKAKKLNEKILSFQYPAIKFPDKISSLNLSKKPLIEGKLLAIKGQYLIFDCGALNMRRHQGYEISMAF
ncbi:MAG: DUF2797 domain-containing protein [Bacteriovoracaceae bacterium]